MIDDLSKFDIKQFEDACNRVLPGLTMFVRDVNLPEETALKYTAGIILRDPTFCDTTYRVGGMATSHRYAVLSNHYQDVSQYEHGTNWGLCVCQNNSHFKVLDVYELNGKTMIVLLHLDEDWKLFQDVKINIEDDLVSTCRERFKAKYNTPVIPELGTEDWLNRCMYPIGIDDNNDYFALEEPDSTNCRRA
jgi:hypothetical protein